MRIYTKGGDDGSTGLLFGGRVMKDDLRTQAAGAIDEAVAALGLARSLAPHSEGLAELILGLQKQLFVLGAEVSTSSENYDKLTPGVSAVTKEMATVLEDEIDRIVALAPLPDYFVVPGACPVSAAIDLARSIVRRAERWIVKISRGDELIGANALVYVNRLSDLLFVAARLEESSRGLDAPSSR